MNNITTTQISSDAKATSVVARLRSAFADMSYANRRLFELQTGTPRR